MSELQGLQSRLADLKALDARVVAVSCEDTDILRGTAEDHEFDFSLLSDSDFEAIRAFGLLHPGGSMDGTDVSRPATFVISDGVVRWRTLTENWRVRPGADEIVEIVGELPPPTG